LFAAHPPTIPTIGRPTTARSRQQSESTLARHTVAADLSHKHRPIIQVGVDPIQLVYGSHSIFTPTKFHFAILLVGFFITEQFVANLHSQW